MINIFNQRLNCMAMVASMAVWCIKRDRVFSFSAPASAPAETVRAGLQHVVSQDTLLLEDLNARV